MWFCFPPFEACEKINHVLVTFEHDHRIVTATIDPTSACIRPDIDAAPGGFASGSVSTGHRDLPGDVAQGFGSISIRLRRPVRVMIFVAILLIRLWNNTPGFRLDLAFLEHQRMLVARPILN